MMRLEERVRRRGKDGSGHAADVASVGSALRGLPEGFARGMVRADRPFPCRRARYGAGTATGTGAVAPVRLFSELLVRPPADQQEDREDRRAPHDDDQPEQVRDQAVHRSRGVIKAIRPQTVMARSRITPHASVLVQAPPQDRSERGRRCRGRDAEAAPRLAGPGAASCRGQPPCSAKRSEMAAIFRCARATASAGSTPSARTVCRASGITFVARTSPDAAEGGAP